MSRPNRGGFSAWLRGGQTVGHTFDMVMEVFRRIAVFGLVWAIVCVVLVNVKSTDDQQEHGFISMQAGLFAFLGAPAPQTLSVPVPGGTSAPFAVEKVGSLPWVKHDADIYADNVRIGFLLWFAGLALGVISTAWWFTASGKHKLKTRQMRGQKVVHVRELVKEISAFNAEERTRKNRPDYVAAKVVGIPLPFDAEHEHFMALGGPGSGKSVALHTLFLSIRDRKDKAVIYDPETEYIKRHYNPDTDIILNPFDDRSPCWSPFYDAREHVDWDRFAHGLFKDPKTGDPYWTSVARSLFSWTCFTLQERNPDVTLDTALRLLFGPTKRLARLLEGTPAGKHIAGEHTPRTSALESVLVEGVTPLIYLLGDRKPFSIRKWINAPKKEPGFLFLSAPDTHADTLRPLLGFWSEIAVSALLSREAEGIPAHPTWICLDEFPSLGRIDRLADGPQRLRKYGGAMVFGLQQYSQLQDIYGRERAMTILGQCQNKLILRASDNDTATMLSQILGERIMHRVSENTSYGANSIRDGVGIAPREEKEPVYLPTDIMNFPSLQGVIRVSNRRPGVPFPIAPVRFEYKAMPQVAKPFIARTGPDPVREFLKPTPKPAPRPSDEESAGGRGLVISQDEGAQTNGEGPEPIHTLPMDPAALPNRLGHDMARRRLEEEARAAGEQLTLLNFTDPAPENHIDKTDEDLSERDLGSTDFALDQRDDLGFEAGR